MAYSFHESAENHAARLAPATFRRVRTYRNALLSLLNGYNYAGQPYWVSQFTVDDLLHRLAVIIQGETFVPVRDGRSEREIAEDSAGEVFRSNSGNKTEERVAAGVRIGSIPYPYQQTINGTRLTDEWCGIVAELFNLLSSGASYGEAAGYLNDLGLKTATGTAWNKDNTRAFCQLAEHCGYAKKPVTSSDKHGPFWLYVPFACPTINPPVSLDFWLSANNLSTKFLGVTNE